ncbi:hypothetical protein Bca52824_060118 [Brassica carinata]|uniref:Uncharacterized protein n=1 Tax=Brassica carinata TaxID=52824 RepID=A0A8X7R0U0_BRACI|nr:hypothetical protein Bca52824_060118 [Brassica carinata]
MATLVNGTSPETVEMMKATSNGVFQGESPLDFAFPLVILQICLVVAVTRSLAFLLRPMRQPRVVAEIIRADHGYIQFFGFVCTVFVVVRA